MTASGIVGINAGFFDFATRETKVIQKSALIEESSDVDSAVVAIISGTVGTVAESLSISPTTYRDSAGNLVSFPNSAPPTRLFLRTESDVPTEVYDNDLGVFSLLSRNGEIAATNWKSSSPESGISVVAFGGTSSYSIVIVREV